MKPDKNPNMDVEGVCEVPPPAEELLAIHEESVLLRNEASERLPMLCRCPHIHSHPVSTMGKKTVKKHTIKKKKHEIEKE